MENIRRLNRVRFSLSALFIALATSVQAADRTWTGANSTWTTGAGGFGGLTATNGSNGAVFYDPAATNLTVNVSGNPNTGYVVFYTTATASVNINTDAGSLRLSDTVGSQTTGAGSGSLSVGNGLLYIYQPSSGAPTNQISGSGNLILGAASESGTTNFTFTNASSNLFTISAPILFSQGSAAITRSLLVNGTGNISISGAISESAIATAPVGNITKSNSGILTLSNIANAYTGTTTVSGGVLSVTKLANGGTTSSIGASTNAAANLIVNGGTLRYTGTGNSTDRLFTVGTGAAATLEANGTGALNFTNTSALGTTGSGARTLTLSGTNTGNNTMAAAVGDGIGGATSLVKAGAGNWVLSGNNTYSGTTTVSAGTLLVNGSVSSPVVVSAAAVLGGSGTISGAVRINTGGTLSPGNSPGILNTGSLTLAGTEYVQLGKAPARSGLQPLAGTDYDQVNVTGSVTLTGGDLTVSILTGIETNDLYFIINNDSSDPVTGVFATLGGLVTDLSQGMQFTVGGRSFQISYTADYTGGTFLGGNDVALRAVPEPETWILVGITMGAAFIFRRSRRD